MVTLLASVRPAALGTALGIAVALAGNVRLAVAEPAAAPSADDFRKLIWKRQFGTSEDNEASGVATDTAGNIVVTINGFAGPNFYQTFLRKYDGEGRILLHHFLGDAYASAVASGSLGSVVVGGYRYSANVGGLDTFVARYDPAGTLLWTTRIGDTTTDFIEAVATDADDNVLVTGFTSANLFGPGLGGSDAFVAKYSPAGEFLWAQQFGTPSYDTAEGIAADGDGNVLVSGSTTGALAAPHGHNFDAYLAKYDSGGNMQWIRQFGTSTEDFARGVAVDPEGDIFVAGNTYGNIGGRNRGSDDAFVVKYSALGAPLWQRRLGSPESDGAYAVAADGDGNVVIGGLTSGAVAGRDHGGLFDGFIAKYDGAGMMLWRRQFGTEETDWLSDLKTDNDRNIVVAGWTGGALAGRNRGGHDAIVLKYGP